MTRRTLPPVVLVPMLIVAIVISSSACGTMANFNGGRIGMIEGPSFDAPERPPIAYGGVLWDVNRAVKSDASASMKAFFFPVWLVDFGLSAGLDTVTLPIVIWINVKRAYERATGTQPEKATISVPLLPIQDESTVEKIEIGIQTSAERVLFASQPDRMNFLPKK